jgi:glycosyltransferase involved in cell wall biosynthesis
VTPGQMLEAGTPFVVFGDDWGRNVSTMQHLFRQLTARHPVVWVNGIGHRVPSIRRKDLKRALQKARAMFVGGTGSDGSDLDLGGRPQRVIQPKVLPWHHLTPVRAYNTRNLISAVKRALADEGITTPPIVVTGTPPSASIIGRLGEHLSVYLCMDDFLSLPNVSPRMLGPLEQELLQKVDAVVSTAQALVDTKRPRSGRGYYLPQGVNFKHFASPQPEPLDLRGLPRPIIGFAGGVTSPMDFALVERVARANPGASIVLVGPVGEDSPRFEAPNIHVLGRRPYQSLPAYVQTFDVGLIPYMLNAHSIAVDPLKLLEYLAAGVPVVTTDLPEVRKYAEAVLIGRSHDEFDAAVTRAVRQGRTEKGPEAQSFARQHGWDRRADRLLQILAEVATAKSAELAHQ